MLSPVTNTLIFSSNFTCFFKLCKYWNEPQIITKIVCDGVYSVSINVFILLNIDYSQAFFVPHVIKCGWLNLERKNNVWFSHKISQNQQVMMIYNTFNIIHSKLFWVITIIIALMSRSADELWQKDLFLGKISIKPHFFTWVTFFMNYHI